MAKKEHEAETFVRLLEEAFQRDLKELNEWAMIDGRPMFSVELSEAQEMVLWSQGPAAQVKLLENVLKWGGPKAVARKRAEMERKMAEYQAQFSTGGA